MRTALALAFVLFAGVALPLAAQAQTGMGRRAPTPTQQDQNKKQEEVQQQQQQPQQQPPQQQDDARNEDEKQR
ncbi:MAG: hypothetical protein JNN30_01070 [Rhodanobacteraceae bacterium]|nr:hypothetical protein [Rhodanobacteraceae bacterium]